MNPLQVAQQGPYGEGGPCTGHFAYLSKTSSFRFPVNEPSLKVPFTESLAGDALPLELSFIHLSKSPIYEPPLLPPHTRFPSDGKGPQWREMPVSRDFLKTLWIGDADLRLYITTVQD